MPPSPVNFPQKMVEEELARVGVYLLDTFPDGQTRWGNDSNVAPFSGSSAMADPYKGGYDLAAIQGILNKCDRAGHYSLVEDRLLARVGEI
jgi:hypothetical protein